MATYINTTASNAIRTINIHMLNPKVNSFLKYHSMQYFYIKNNRATCLNLKFATPLLKQRLVMLKIKPYCNTHK